MKSSTLIFFVNGRKVQDDHVDPEWTLLRYLREKLQLPGTKFGCGEGGCGACTVMVSRIDRKTAQIKHFSVNACLAPIGTMHGVSVTTTEGIGSTKTRLHPVQERIAMAHGSQCGFCTPGFVMSMYTLLRNHPSPNMEQIEEYLVGNLCRCTGYRPILEGFRTFTADSAVANGCGRSDCCQLQKGSPPETPGNVAVNGQETLEKTTVLFDAKRLKPYDPSQEVIFPPELKLNPKLDSESLVFTGSRLKYFRPVDLAELTQLKNSFPEAKIVAGNTEIGVECRFKNIQYPVLIHTSHIEEMMKFEVNSSYVEIGASLPLSEVEAELKRVVGKLPEYKTKTLRAICEMLKWFAGCQIRNVASLGGNIMTGSPISDLNPIFLASGSKLIFRNIDNQREIEFDRNFYTSYRKNTSKPNEVLVAVKIPLTTEDDHFMAYKQSRRKDDDIAIVNAAMKASFRPGTLQTQSVSLAFGGMAPTTITAEKTMRVLRGQTWNQDLLEAATTSLLKEMELDPSVPGGMADYRRALTASFFFKFYLTVCQELHAKHPNLISPLKKDERELICPLKEHTAKSTQFFQNVPEGQERIDPVGRPIVNLSSFKQATGEAVYIDDIPSFKNELHAALVLSTRAHAKILSFDPSEALKMEGVRGFFCAKDVPGSNAFGPSQKDDEFFASKEVKHIGQIIGIVVASDASVAKLAAKKVRVDYEDIPNPIFTIEEALAANSTWEPFVVEDGNVEKGFQESDYILEGESYIGGQEHFYMETNVHIAIPHEGGEMELISGTQGLAGTQLSVAEALGVESHLVTCKTRRLGGGFGGKEFRTIAICGPVAIAAANLQRPVRIVMERDEDMLVTGGRHPYLGRWKVGFTKGGKLVALNMELYSNGGYSLDLSYGVLTRSVFTSDNAYKVPNMKVTGVICRTNLPSNVAFRGFGTPQSCFVMESIVTRVSEFLQEYPETIREKNFLQSGDKTFYKQKLFDCSLSRCWNEVIESSDFHRRAKTVQEFNRNNRFRKRGLSIIPSKFGVSFGLSFLMQGGALVLVYKDGSVLVSHGGVEMGQGIHTKMAQVASRALEIPISYIHITETSTDKVPNASPSAASSTADLNGIALLNACNEIKSRLEPYRKKMPEGEWKDWVKAAYFDRIKLFEAGFYKTPVAPYSKTADENCIYNYFTYGAAVSEVEIDCLTGHHKLMRTDIVMDVGTSINPAIDIGQIEGGFVQGMGLYVMEQLVYSASGALLSKGPGAYKIPSVQDIPPEFNVSLLRDGPTTRAIYSSKAIGEPPYFSGASVYFALREAIKAARNHKPRDDLATISPLTAERIRMGCEDHITEQIPKRKEGTYKSWSLNI